MPYKVKQTPDGKHWIVVDETGFIANNCKHKTPEEAERHKANIEAHCGKIKQEEIRNDRRRSKN
jgi:hypothetical protein